VLTIPLSPPPPPQASTNTLLCHVVGLLFTNLMLRIVNKVPKTAAPVVA
jgi:hypothetical protein